MFKIRIHALALPILDPFKPLGEGLPLPRSRRRQTSRFQRITLDLVVQDFLGLKVIGLGSGWP